MYVCMRTCTWYVRVGVCACTYIYIQKHTYNPERNTVACISSSGLPAEITTNFSSLNAKTLLRRARFLPYLFYSFSIISHTFFLYLHVRASECVRVVYTRLYYSNMNKCVVCSFLATYTYNNYPR